MAISRSSISMEIKPGMMSGKKKKTNPKKAKSAPYARGGKVSKDGSGTKC